MGREPTVPEWPRWFRVLCYGLLAVIILGLSYRALADAATTHEALQGLGGVAILCLLLSYQYLSKTRWRDRTALSGLALLACLAVVVGILALLVPEREWLDREFAILLGLGTLFALTLILSRYVSLSGRPFGILVSAAGLGIVGLGVLEFDSSTLGGYETIGTGAVCLLIGLCYVVKPEAMAELERQARE
ncbi:uncharacterized protein Nmag_1867 [Natrialba magadii ATCC 43099]|uniref:Uncharacterized protein n=1 Tax=Natrialba magadii (strain ATCC 43099 / DSM 3394 / CCM 3739 / CIP 104546 / IAM 13178 / JCM 8861 / NBRC 102185 / NCIMB 2190 / MS3) TaxID=547559 RepID=D3SV32_NATMM|nr:hypothetical protein [Natrialba magadii]ADD05440.1 uncharacterized protein Nmag_1867 [Natrialba magadii ATCC 43099]ELY29246.1 hypothetical protein C500_11030 [Natrialba magadii ATCC 43099]